MQDVILYHSSRGGISGDITPSSRARCDFGKGFYLGTNPDQVKGLVSDAQDPVIYRVKLQLSKIQEDKILILDGMDWVYAVLVNRERVPDFLSTNLAKNIKEEMSKYDVIIGPIADDRMNEAIRQFENYALTDKGLMACLSAVDYGYQFAVKTQHACDLIEILYEKDLYGQELEYARQYTYEHRQESKNIIQQAQMKYQREGLFLNEIVDREKKKDFKQFKEDEWER